MENIPYHEIMNAINEASRNVSILLNRKLQVAPVFIKSVRKQEDTNAVPKSEEHYIGVQVVNIVTQYEIWQVFLDETKSKIDNCFIVLKGDFTQQGYKKGIWSNIEYCGFYGSVSEAENEIQGHLE